MTCTIPNCKRKALHRGLCRACLTSAKRAVQAGKTTWEELERLGIATRPREHSLVMQAVYAKRGLRVAN